jgi:predicted porin
VLYFINFNLTTQVKKTTLAAILLAAFAASAHAQSNVTVYGVVDLGFAKTNGKTLIERENHASRLGFRGVEDLGNGLSAIFNLESEILADTGAQKGVLWERQANVGLKGAFGTVIMGRTKNIVDGAQGRVEPFGADGVVGKVNEALMRVGVSSSRVSNALTYSTPKYSGFGASVQYVLSEVNGADAGVDLLATYDQGPVSLHAGYERAAQLVPGPANPHMAVVGGGYKFGDLRLTAAYAKGDTDVASTGTFKGMLVGLNYSVGAGDVHAVAARQTQSNNAFSDKQTVREYGVGYDYHLSKRTDLYAYAGREQVAKLTSYQMGISHKF